jgi:hypothetical protein
MNGMFMHRYYETNYWSRGSFNQDKCSWGRDSNQRLPEYETTSWCSVKDYSTLKLKKLNSMVWVRERTIPTERLPLVGEVIANVCGYRVPRGQRDGSLRSYSRFSRQEPLLFYQVAPQLWSRGWVDPVPDPLLFFLLVPEIEPGPLDL